MAWAIAIVADTLQIAALPFFAEGGISPLDTGLDLVVAAVLTKLLGWHWAFLPTFTAELIPGLDLVPTWTAAVFYVTFGRLPPMSQARFSRKMARKSCHRDRHRRGDNWRARKSCVEDLSAWLCDLKLRGGAGIMPAFAE